MSWHAAIGTLTRFGTTPAGQNDAEAAWGGCFTLVATGIGCALAAVSAACLWVGGPRAGVGLAALALPATEIWLTRGRGYGDLVNTLETCPLPAAPVTAVYARLAAFQGILLVKIGAFATLAATGRGTWIILAYALAGAVTWWNPGAERPAEPCFWTRQAPGLWSHWLLAVAIALTAALAAGALLMGLTAILAAWLVPRACIAMLDTGAGAGRSVAPWTWELVLLTTLLIGALRALV